MHTTHSILVALCVCYNNKIITVEIAFREATPCSFFLGIQDSLYWTVQASIAETWSLNYWEVGMHQVVIH